MKMYIGSNYKNLVPMKVLNVHNNKTGSFDAPLV